MIQYPARFGKYLLLDLVNVGGMAEVFLAKTFGVEGFERLVAVKRIHPQLAADTEFVEMFVDEARIAAQLHHVNVVQIHELGRQDGAYYITMEYVSGKDLRYILGYFWQAGRKMPLPMVAYIASKICDGL